MVTFFCLADLELELTKAFVFCEWKGLAYWLVVGVPGCRKKHVSSLQVLSSWTNLVYVANIGHDGHIPLSRFGQNTFRKLA